MPCHRIFVPLLTAIIVLGSARAKAEDQPPPGWQNERYVIQPGAEDLFGLMLGRGETLPGGCKLTDGKIQRSSVLATYTCGEAAVGLELDHPGSSPAGAVSTQRFAVVVKSGTPPGGLVEGVAERIRAHEAGFEWKDLGPRNALGNRWWLAAVAAGAAAALLAFRALRRRRPAVS